MKQNIIFVTFVLATLCGLSLSTYPCQDGEYECKCDCQNNEQPCDSSCPDTLYFCNVTETCNEVLQPCGTNCNTDIIFDLVYCPNNGTPICLPDLPNMIWECKGEKYSTTTPCDEKCPANSTTVYESPDNKTICLPENDLNKLFWSCENQNYNYLFDCDGKCQILGESCFGNCPSLNYRLCGEKCLLANEICIHEQEPLCPDKYFPFEDKECKKEEGHYSCDGKFQEYGQPCNASCLDSTWWTCKDPACLSPVEVCISEKKPCYGVCQENKWVCNDACQSLLEACGSDCSKGYYKCGQGRCKLDKEKPNFYDCDGECFSSEKNCQGKCNEASELTKPCGPKCVSPDAEVWTCNNDCIGQNKPCNGGCFNNRWLCEETCILRDLPCDGQCLNNSLWGCENTCIPKETPCDKDCPTNYWLCEDENACLSINKPCKDKCHADSDWACKDECIDKKKPCDGTCIDGKEPGKDGYCTGSSAANTLTSTSLALTLAFGMIFLLTS